MYSKNSGKNKRKGRKMIQSPLGLVDKMLIDVYTDSEYKNLTQTIFVQLNPNHYTSSQRVNYTKEEATGSITSNSVFNRIESQVVSLEFLFDGTGVVPPGKIKKGGSTMSFLESASKEFIAGNTADTYISKSIDDDLNKFKKLLMGYDGKTHQTPYLELIWGSFNLQCRLTNMEIQYTLFNNSGSALRAIAKCQFEESSPVKIMTIRKKNSSPDMTHERVFTMNDKIPLMAKEIYDSNKYYIDVAKSNSLLSFRTAAVGTDITFPPIKN
jgi:Contractile injection system tube protein